jgi:hypothetical protein
MTETDNVIKARAQSGTDKHSGTSQESQVTAQEELTPDSFPQDIKDIIARLRIIVDHIDSPRNLARDFIQKLARSLDERKLCEKGRISVMIKGILQDKIQAGKITERWIRKCLSREYKRGYEGDKGKRELSSLSKKPIPVPRTRPTTKQEQDKEQADLAENPQLKQEVIVHLSGQEAVAKPRHLPEENLTKTQEVRSGNGTRIGTDTSPPQHEQSANTITVPATGLRFPIPKEKYEMVIDAMDRSKSAIFVECDESKKFVRVVADVDN